jgi:DNA-3-methyladenine glycosylase
MPFSSIIPKSFYERPTLEVARDLLGKRLVHNPQGVRITGTIVETEAYRGEEDQACHARAGRTPRTSIMYGHAGMAYIYFTYGMHWLLNCVTEREGFPAAVLLRAIIPLEGQEQMALPSCARQWALTAGSTALTCAAPSACCGLKKAPASRTAR